MLRIRQNFGVLLGGMLSLGLCFTAGAIDWEDDPAELSLLHATAEEQAAWPGLAKALYENHELRILDRKFRPQYYANSTRPNHKYGVVTDYMQAVADYFQRHNVAVEVTANTSINKLKIRILPGSQTRLNDLAATLAMDDFALVFSQRRNLLLLDEEYKGQSVDFGNRELLIGTWFLMDPGQIDRKITAYHLEMIHRYAQQVPPFLVVTSLKMIGIHNLPKPNNSRPRWNFAQMVFHQRPAIFLPRNLSLHVDFADFAGRMHNLHRYIFAARQELRHTSMVRYALVQSIRHTYFGALNNLVFTLANLNVVLYFLQGRSKGPSLNHTHLSWQSYPHLLEMKLIPDRQYCPDFGMLFYLYLEPGEVISSYREMWQVKSLQNLYLYLSELFQGLAQVRMMVSTFEDHPAASLNILWPQIAKLLRLPQEIVERPLPRDFQHHWMQQVGPQQAKIERGIHKIMAHQKKVNLPGDAPAFPREECRTNLVPPSSTRAAD